MCLPDSLEYLQINNINIEFATTFSHSLAHLKTLDLQNRNKRKKNFDENEIKAIHKFCPNLFSLIINKAPLIDDTMFNFLQRFNDLSKIFILKIRHI